ncbi:MAG: hypothetical protein KF788_06685 [Piscinibacter sp.]|nr:hypothetical protein [Piscinibacter sp.]
MANPFATDWGNVYNPAVNAFSKDIKTCAQKDLDEGRAVMGLLGKPKDGTAKLLAAMVELDKVKFGSPDPKVAKASLATYEAQVKLLKSAQGTYAKLLDTAMSGEIVSSQTKKKVKLKDLAPDSYRQLKVLSTELAAIVARAEQMLKSQQVVKQSDKINEKQQKDMAKAKSEEARKAVEAEARLKKMLLTLNSGFVSSISKGKAAIQKIKAKPDLKTYNEWMNNAGRDISQNLVNIKKMKDEAGLKDMKQVKALADPKSLATEIAVYGNGARRKLPDSASAQDVKKALDDFSDLVKRIEAQYANALKG